jgi:hypothetical protein
LSASVRDLAKERGIDPLSTGVCTGNTFLVELLEGIGEPTRSGYVQEAGVSLDVQISLGVTDLLRNLLSHLPQPGTEAPPILAPSKSRHSIC